MLGLRCYSLLWAPHVHTRHTPRTSEVTVAALIINTVVKDWTPGRLGLSGGRNSWYPFKDSSQRGRQGVREAVETQRETRASPVESGSAFTHGVQN
jgi:hypothetical protein